MFLRRPIDMPVASQGFATERKEGDPSLFAMVDAIAAYDPAGNYPLGTNLAVYIGPKNFMVEMETMGAFATLKPGQVLKHRETWLLAAAKSAPTAKALRKLF